MRKISFLTWIALIIVILGGLDWGLVGLFHFNLVNAIFGPMSLTARLIYIVIGLAAAYMVYWIFKKKKAKD